MVADIVIDCLLKAFDILNMEYCVIIILGTHTFHCSFKAFDINKIIVVHFDTPNNYILIF